MEFKELAISANKMLDDKIKAEKHLRKSEKNLKDAQRITHFGSWELDIEKNELFWSDEVYRIFGLNPNEYTPSYEKFLSYVHPDDKHDVDNAYHLSIKNNTTYDVEHRICLSNGEIKHVRGHAETTYDDKGNAIRSSGTVQDITELKEKDDQLKLYNCYGRYKAGHFRMAFTTWHDRDFNQILIEDDSTTGLNKSDGFSVPSLNTKTLFKYDVVSVLEDHPKTITPPSSTP